MEGEERRLEETEEEDDGVKEGVEGAGDQRPKKENVRHET